jgi:alanine racemase
VIAVVKADGYGHGAERAARAFLDAGCARLAVISVAEAEELRQAAIAAPILVLGGVHDTAEARRAVALRLCAALHHEAALGWSAEAARDAGTKALIQVEVDTGMRRMGLPVERAAEVVARVVADPLLELEGVYTHLARAEESDPAASLEQLARFRALLADLRERGISPPFIHVVNSAGLLAGAVLAKALPEANAVRPGLMLYGVRPTAELPEGVVLTPAMTFRTRVAAVHDLAAGDPVGYGGSYRASAPTRVATLDAGYADGIPWTASNRGEMWLAGARRPIRGRVSMDYTAVEVGDAAVQPGDDAIVFGLDGAAGIAVEDAASAAGTLAYELLVRVGGRVPRREV